MEVDSEEVKRHLDILGYTHIEPSLLNDFIEDLKKIIEYDRKHNNVSQLSASLYKDWDQSYSQRMKNSTPNKNAIDRNRTTDRNEHEDEANLMTKRKNQNCISQTSKTIDLHNTTPLNKRSKCESEFTPTKCYFCGCIPMENQPRMKVKHSLNPLHTLHLGITFDIEF
ncbi:uncharacterized protein LOC126549372 [Aphis gossypii]|uniref:Uncharacterized protein n=1 Tax=Aphis gossypii TaxID=80765 RepID=A0A9P0IMG6_APHGO|nr:uncharacterized protein LOC114132279 [Aphis gossypii]XP_050054267.1 uncharacterized protein LOC126549372 [Aphis gossypii]CAH1711310.1 unnamed protein product [Aphis gossypii]